MVHKFGSFGFPPISGAQEPGLGEARRLLQGLPHPHELTDIGRFSPSPAIYFMDGRSSATIRILASGEQLTFNFSDENTSISSGAPFVFDPRQAAQSSYTIAPPPLKPIAHFPEAVPDSYKRQTTVHLLQVVSMNMRDATSGARLLIGLPYVQQAPDLFFRTGVFEGGVEGASSYGIVSSLTEFTNPATRRKEVDSNGYPARSVFAIYHLLETRIGTFFNKKPTVMELQPNREGKLAIKLPPIPFNYRLINGPIPLFDSRRPDGPAVAETITAAHGADRPATIPTPAWPFK